MQKIRNRFSEGGIVMYKGAWKIAIFDITSLYLANDRPVRKHGYS